MDLPRLAAGGVRIVFSVLYLPWTEIDDPDRDGDYDELLARLEEVEAELHREPAKARPVVVKSEADLDRALAENRIAIVHSIEGGMHLGGDVNLISDRVAELARKGVSYITLAHLFYRGVATNAPALPMLSDRAYNTIFCQPKEGGLSPIGEAAVRAMYEHGVLVDVSHMREDALAETFALLRSLDSETGADPMDHPVIATHAGYRFGDQAYMLGDDTIREIAARDGVIGLIMAEHQLYDGIDFGDATGFDATLEAVHRHIDAIHKVTGSHAHVGIGSDLDGFIKPTVAGIAGVDDLGDLREPLRQEYGDADARRSSAATQSGCCARRSAPAIGTPRRWRVTAVGALLRRRKKGARADQSGHGPCGPAFEGGFPSVPVVAGSGQAYPRRLLATA